jgi:hypothetical protein
MSEPENMDEKFDDFVRREARSYNAPPDLVPREEMWKAIGEARRASHSGAGGRGPGVNPRHRLTYALIGMAATLVVGAAIGKYALGTRETAPAGVPVLAAAASDTAGASYAVATSEHLARAEALLTAFGNSSPDPASDAQLASWARDVLSSTRLLLDSPAAREPARRRMLEDLELVLVQIVQRSPTDGAAEERAHVERTMERTQVLPRLRSMQSSGANRGT